LLGQLKMRQPKQTGLTLMELLLSVTILGILAAFAVPDIALLLNRQRLRDAQNELNSVYRVTRWEAARSGSDTTFRFTPSSGGLAWSAEVTNANGTLKTLDSARFSCVVSCSGTTSVTLSAGRALPTATGSPVIRLTSRACTRGQYQSLFDQACNIGSKHAMDQLCANNPGYIAVTIHPTGQSSVDNSQCPGA